MPNITADRLLFLDFEASSLEADSWPIEVGVARINNGHVHHASHLIRPHPSWNPEAWSLASQAVHGITRAQLQEHGTAAPDAAAWTLDTMAGMLVVSDNPGFETMWLKRLMSSQKHTTHPIPTVHDYDAALASVLDARGLDGAYAFLGRTPRPHRAGPDAALMAQAVLVGLDVQEGRRPLRP